MKGTEAREIDIAFGKELHRYPPGYPLFGRATKSMPGLNAMYLHKSPLNVAGLQIYSFFSKCSWIIWTELVLHIIYCVFTQS